MSMDGVYRHEVLFQRSDGRTGSGGVPVSEDPVLRPWRSTERQPYVAIAAPGVGVGGVLKDGRIHTSNGGTSGATALTSGGIALLRSKFPEESRTDILKRVFGSLRDAGPSGRDDQTGYGVFRPSMR
jgi:hypothetical protein